MAILASEGPTTSDYLRGALCGLSAVCIWAAFIVVSRLGVSTSLTPWDVVAIRLRRRRRYSVAPPLETRAGPRPPRMARRGCRRGRLRCADGAAGERRPALCTGGTRWCALSGCHAADGRITGGGDPEGGVHAAKDRRAYPDHTGRGGNRMGHPAAPSAPGRTSATCSSCVPDWRGPVTRLPCGAHGSMVCTPPRSPLLRRLLSICRCTR